jgi:hypothetical protein
MSDNLAEGAGRATKVIEFARAPRVPDAIIKSSGRSLSDFRNEKTETGLRPAEMELLLSVAKGEQCDRTDRSARSKMIEQLEKATSDAKWIKLAAEIIASTENKTKGAREVRKKLMLQVDEQPRILREFLTELPNFVENHPQASKKLKIKAVAKPDLLRPIIDGLKTRFKSELFCWRAVERSDQVFVRADFLRFLALGGDDATPVHEKGVRLKGAFIDGELDISSCLEVWPLEFHNCVFSEGLDFSGARLRRVSLSGSHVRAIEGVRCRAKGSMFFDDGFFSAGSVRLIGATIDGNLDCTNGKFSDGLHCDNAKIGGDLDCCEGTFETQMLDGESDALSCGGASIGGGVDLGGFHAKGTVTFSGAVIAGSFNGRRGVFDHLVLSKRSTNMYSEASAPMAATALDLSLSKIGRALVLGPT